MTSLAYREQLLLAGVLAAVLIGAAVKHWRDARREVPRAVAVETPRAPGSPGPVEP